MREELPIACSLTASELPPRLREIAAIGRDALIGVGGEPGSPVLHFSAGADTGVRLRAIVAAESECCAFLDLRLGEQPGEITLTIGGPPDAAPIVAGLVEAFRAESAAPPLQS